MAKRRCLATVVLAVIFLSFTVLLFSPRPLGDNRAEAAPSSDIGVLLKVYEYIRGHYLNSPDLGRLVDSAIKAMVDALGDPYTTYMNADEFSRYTESFKGSFGGIGVVIEIRDSYVTINSVIQGSPAEAAGLLKDDRIIEVDGESIVGLDLTQAGNRIRGPVGTMVRLKIHRPSADLLFTVDIVRYVVQLTTVEYSLLPGSIGYVKITSFNDNTSVEAERAYRDLLSRGVKAWILDLRGNLGGLLDESIEVADLFVPAGPIVHIVDKRGIRETFEASGRSVGLPVAVLVNSATASASEIVAGAIQDSGVGVLVGQKTYGKGSVQSLFTLENGGGLKITTAKYLTPQGREINNTGLEPDIYVEKIPFAVIHIPPLVDEGRELAKGSRGDAVTTLQKALIALDQDPGPVDGIFGRMTEAAVRSFQKAAGLSPTGVADRQTLITINHLLREKYQVENQEAADKELHAAIQYLQSKMVH